MRVKSMFIVIVLNIFVMLASTVVFEYINLSERFISIEDSVQEALDSAIESSIGSEELFSSEYQAKMSSFGITGDGKSNTSEIHTLVWLDSENRFYKVNTYLLAYFYNKYHRLPNSVGDINELNSFGTGGVLNGQTGFVYEWLYGEQKTDYRDSSLAWANRNTSRQEEYKDSNAGTRANNVNSNFRDYYENVGMHQKTVGYLKERSGSSDSFDLNPHIYPTLMNMGFDFMSDGVSTPYTKTDSNITHDNFTSTFHVGKAINGQAQTYYYLTPKSLGVTYIPIEVLKPTFISSLDTIVRLNYIGGSSTSGHTGSNLGDASKCVETNVYDSSQKKHTKSTLSEDIVTDGLVEFDLSTVSTKIDYFYINFSSAVTSQSSREKVISRVNGAVQSYTSGKAQDDGISARQKTLSAFIAENNDTSSLVSDFGTKSLKSDYDTVRNGRIIARVAVRIKVHVPYQSSMLQWMCNKFGENNNHYDIKLWDEFNDKADASSDGIWYQYTTYYCTSRS